MNNQATDKQAQYKQAIRAVYPDFEIRTAEFREGGQYNDLLIVNGDLIFRFSRNDEALETLAKSVAITRTLQGRVPLAVPNPIYANLETREIGKAFAGYRMIPGEVVDIYGLEQRYDAATCQRLADQLADFLKALHSVPAEAIGYALPNDHLYAHYTDFYARVRDHLFPLMRPDARTTIEKDFEAYLSDKRNFEYPRVLIHGDFGTGNILFDAEKEVFTGVIDFDFAGLSDSCFDIAAIYGFQGRGAAFARRFFVRYPELEAVMQRVTFRTNTYLLYDALLGVETNDPELVKSGLEPYV